MKGGKHAIRCGCMLATGYCGSGRSIEPSLLNEGASVPVAATLEVRVKGGANAERS